MDWSFHGEPHLYWGELIYCLSDHDNDAYSHGEVTMLGSNGTCLST
jgi:hypothetical protein